MIFFDALFNVCTNSDESDIITLYTPYFGIEETWKVSLYCQQDEF